MWRTFNIAMRIVSSLIGIAMILIGVVWILQGLNLAFRVGFMVGNNFLQHLLAVPQNARCRQLLVPGGRH